MRKACKLLKPLSFLLVLTLAFFYVFSVPSFAIVTKQKCRHNLEGKAYYNTLKLSAKIQKPIFRPGEDVKVDVNLSNIGQYFVNLYFSSSQQFDLVVEDMQGNEVYRWSKGMMFAQAITSVTLQPNQSISQQFSFKLANKGFYRIKGETAKMYFNQLPSTTLITTPILILVR